ncbi:MAG: GNAT family N-acetyltransferase [Candidatus Rokubacteria bacterium]|nr:GNAT family N-acetyltransferase [Candidatus Rokubacteria bacterium]
MATSPVLETPRVRVAPFTLEHVTSGYLGWLNDPTIVRFSEQRHRRHTRESCRAYMESFDGTANYFWALVVRGDGLGYIGTMTAYTDPGHGVADVGILVGQAAAQGRGYAAEAWLAVCDFLFRVAGMRKVTAGTIAPNVAMLNLMKRVGMREDGRRVRHHLWNGEEVDVIHGALFSDEWRQRCPHGPFGAPSAR